MSKHDLSPEEKQIINERMQVSVAEFNQTLQHAAELLSDITKLASFAMTPSANYDTLKFIRLVPVDEYTIVLMIVSDAGNVTNTTLKVDVSYTPESLEILSKSMTYNYKGNTIDEALKKSIIADFKSNGNLLFDQTVYFLAQHFGVKHNAVSNQTDLAQV